MDTRMNPQGSGQRKARYVGVSTSTCALGELFGGSPLLVDKQVMALRFRATIARINAGFDLLPAVPGVKWQVLDAAMISIGGAASGATTVDLSATQAGSAALLMASAVAGLTQNTLLRAGATNGAILAAGASFIENDVNTAVRVSKTGGSLATSTHIDYLVHFLASLTY